VARRSTSTLARAVSLLFHPLVLSPLTVALTSRSWRWTAIIVVSTMVPITAAILWNVRRGVWSDFDVTHRRQRSGLYRVAIPLFLAAIFFVPAPGWFDRPLIALVAVLIVCFVLSRWLQVSLHLMFAAFCAVILWRAFPLSAVAMACVLAGLAWARLHLEHHTLPEVVVGTLFGLAAGIFTIS
jgi:hypothetical protein